MIGKVGKGCQIWEARQARHASGCRPGDRRASVAIGGRAGTVGTVYVKEILEMTRLLGAAFLLGRLLNAQAIDSLVLIESHTPRIAADSRGNLVTIQQATAAGVCGTSCIAYTLYRYDSHGQLFQTLNDPAQVVNAVGRIVFLTLDSSDNIYVGAYGPDGNAIVVRSSDPPDQAEWKISGAWNLYGLAFDPQGNPVVLLSSTLNTGPLQAVKFDRGSGQMLAAYSFPSYWDYPATVVTDSSGAVYIVGSTSSPDFPLTSGAWPASCGTVTNGRYGCQQAFVTKLDSGLQRVVYSSLLSGGSANAIAVAANGSAYVGGGASFSVFGPLGGPGFVVNLDAQGSVMSSSAFPGGVDDLKLDSSGNVIVIGRTASGSKCGPDRTNLGGSPPVPFVGRLDSQLSGISSSAVIPQQEFSGPAALLADGTLYLAVQPAQTTLEFSGVDFPGVRVLHVSPGKPPSPVTCVVNGASFLAETAVAPGQLLTILGQGLGPDPGVAFDATQQLPFTAQGTNVDIGGLAAPLLYVSPNQINAIVPYGIKLGAQAPIEIHRNGSVIYTWAVDAVAKNPTPLLRFGEDGALVPDDQTKPVVPLANAVNEDGTPNSRQNPAHGGSVVTVYATGYGQLTPSLEDGSPGVVPGAMSNGDSIQSWSGVLQPLSVATIPGWINTVVAVRFQVPNAGPGIVDMVFRLAPPVTSQNIPATFIYVTQ